MSASFELSRPDLFLAGTVGPPGQRIFYLQARQDDSVYTLRCEKQQVSALADYLEGLLAELPSTASPSDRHPSNEVDLVEPAIAEWVIGALAVAYNVDLDRFIIEAEELVVAPEDITEAEAEALLAEAGRALLSVSRAQAARFVAISHDLVSAGRPPCFLCGRALDPEGHLCPRNN